MHPAGAIYIAKNVPEQYRKACPESFEKVAFNDIFSLQTRILWHRTRSENGLCIP
jgi:hypothetical protein